MNLKYFHIFFISICTFLLVGISWMEYSAFHDGGAPEHLHWSIAWGSAAALLVAYGCYFLKKARSIVT